MVISLIIFIWLFLAAFADGAIIYVDRDQSCPGSGTTTVPYCNLQNAFNVVNAGDSIRIRDSASPYDMTGTLTRSGSSGSRITIEPDTGHNPTLRYTGNDADTGVIYLSTVSYVTIQNLTFNGTGVQTSRAAIMVKPDGTNVTGVEIKNNTITNWGGTQSNVGSTAVRAVITVDGGWCNPCSATLTNTLVQGNTISTYRQVGIFAQHATGTVIENNTISGARCGTTVDNTPDQIGIGIWDATDGQSTGYIIRGNTIRDWDPKSNCTLAAPNYGTLAGLWCDVGPQNGLIERNLIYNINQGDAGGSGSYESQGLFIEAACSGWTIRNNIIYNIGNVGIRQRVARGNGGSANVYQNNTIYNVGQFAFEGGDTGSGTGAVTFQNNIVYNSGVAALYFENQTTTINFNNNLYFQSPSTIAYWGGGTGGLNFTNWKSTCGCDSAAVNANPSLVSPGTGNFHISSSGSPAVGAAINLSASFTNDYDNVTRSVPWDIGALEFAGGSVVVRRKVNQN